MSSHSIQMFGAVAECFQGPFPGENCSVQRVLLDAYAEHRGELAKTNKLYIVARAARRLPSLASPPQRSAVERVLRDFVQSQASLPSPGLPLHLQLRS